MAEDQELRGQVGVLREAFGYLTARVDALVSREAEARPAQRRVTITVCIAAASITIAALALVARLVVSAL